MLLVSDSLLEATAWENCFVPEAMGVPTDELKTRIQGSLPPLASILSRLRQSINAGEGILCRYDAATRPYRKVIGRISSSDQQY